MLLHCFMAALYVGVLALQLMPVHAHCYVTSAVGFWPSGPGRHGGSWWQWLHRFQAASADESGNPCPLAWKCFVYTCSMVTWELRRLLLAILVRRETLQLHKLLGGSLLPWVAFLQEHRGLDYNLFLSRKAFTDLEDPSVVPPGAKPYIRGERACASIAIIDLLVFLAVHRRAHDEKKLAELFVTGPLHHMPTAGEAATVAKLTLSAEGHEACTCAVADGVCCHVRGVCMLLPGTRPDPHKQLMEVLLALFKGIGCPAVLLVPGAQEDSGKPAD